MCDRTLCRAMYVEHFYTKYSFALLVLTGGRGYSRYHLYEQVRLCSTHTQMNVTLRIDKSNKSTYNYVHACRSQIAAEAIRAAAFRDLRTGIIINVTFFKSSLRAGRLRSEHLLVLD